MSLERGWLRRSIALAKEVRIPTPDEYREGLAILRELVGDRMAGVHIVWPAESHECCYCNHGDGDIGQESWEYVEPEHHPDCPIRKGREYLARVMSPD